jgi:hypothetical protein
MPSGSLDNWLAIFIAVVPFTKITIPGTVDEINTPCPFATLNRREPGLDTHNLSVLKKGNLPKSVK